jgi:hypothetical protein
MLPSEVIVQLMSTVRLKFAELHGIEDDLRTVFSSVLDKLDKPCCACARK